MRRSRLKILPARCLTLLGFILVMLVCPTIAEINVGIGDVYEPGYSDFELQYPAAKVLRNRFEVCQMKDSPRRLDFPVELPRDIAPLAELPRFSKKSEPKNLHETISRRGERNQNCYDSRRNGDSAMRRSAVKLHYNFGIANREVSEVRGQKLGITLTSRTEGRNSIECPQRKGEVGNKAARERVTSGRRNDMIQRHSRKSPVLKDERLNREDMSYRKIDERNILRRKTANNYSRSVDTRKTSDETRRKTSEILSSARTGAKNGNINERRADICSKSTTERENYMQRLTRRSYSINQNQARISSEVRKPVMERSIVEEERRFKNRGMSSDEFRRIDTQRRQTESERRDFARRTIRMTRTSDLDPTERKLTVSSERRRETREVHFNTIMQNDNRRQQRESTRRDHRAISMARSLERRSSVDSERQEMFSDRASDSLRRDRVSERRNAARGSITIVRSVDSIPAEIMAAVKNERHQKILESTMKVTRLSENRRLDRESERREPTQFSLSRFRSSESITVERRLIVEDKRRFRTPGPISNVVIQTDSRKQESTFKVRDSALPSGRIVGSVRAIASGSSITSTVVSGRRHRTTDISLNFRRGSERKDATRLAVRISRSLEREPEERRPFLGSERQQRIRDASLNSIRQRDSSGKQRQTERRDLPQRIVRTDSSLTPSLSETQRRIRNTAPSTHRQERASEMRDIAHRTSRMVRSVESLERRSILDTERNRENRDATYNTIQRVENKTQQKEFERRELIKNASKMVSSVVRRTVVDSENQWRVRYIASSSRAQQRSDAYRRSIRMTRSLEPILTEKRSTEDSEGRQGTRNAHMNIRRQEMELEGREPNRRTARMVRSTTSVPQERRSHIGIEKLDRLREVNLIPIKHDNRRQQKESERRDLTRRVVRKFRSLESIPVGRRLAVDFDRQERSRDTTLSVRRQKRVIENEDADRRSMRMTGSLESSVTEMRSNLELERQKENSEAIIAKSLERRVVLDLERKERLPYFASKSRRQERGSERRYSIRHDDNMIRATESNHIERGLMLNFVRKQRTQDVFRNSQRLEMELGRRKPELRSVRRVGSTERSPSKRSLVDRSGQERAQAISLSSQRRQMESERRDLRGDRVVREARSLQSTPSERMLPAEYERRQKVQEFSLHTSKQTNNGQQHKEPEKDDFKRQVNSMARSVESFSSRSKVVSGRHQLTQDSTSSFRKQESQTGRRNLARNSRTWEHRNDGQRRAISHSLSLEKQIKTNSATSQAGRPQDFLAAGQGKFKKLSLYINYSDASFHSRLVKDSRRSFISDTEESNNRLVVSRASLNRETSIRKTSVPLSKEGRIVNRSAGSNLRTIENLRLSQIGEGRLDSRPRNGRILSATPMNVDAGMRNRNCSPTRRISQNKPSKISVKMEQIIGNVEVRLEKISSRRDTRKIDDKVPLLGSFYLSETLPSPDAHVNARNVIVVTNEHLLGSARQNAIRNSHLLRDMMSRTAIWRSKVHADLESDNTGSISRDAARASVVRPSKLRSFEPREHRKHLTERKPLMNSLTRRYTALDREMSTLQSDIRASKAMKRSKHFNRRVNDKIMPKLFQDLNGSEKKIHENIPVADSYDVVESYNIIHSNDQGNRLLRQLSQNESSFFTQAHVREMDYSDKIIENPKPFEDKECDQKIGFGLNQDKLFSLTIGGSIAAFLISTSLK